MRYFAMTDQEEITLIGDFEDIQEAFDKEPSGTHWVFSEEGLRQFADKIEEILK